MSTVDSSIEITLGYALQQVSKYEDLEQKRRDQLVEEWKESGRPNPYRPGETHVNMAYYEVKSWFWALRDGNKKTSRVLRFLGWAKGCKSVWQSIANSLCDHPENEQVHEVKVVAEGSPNEFTEHFVHCGVCGGSIL